MELLRTIKRAMPCAAIFLCCHTTVDLLINEDIEQKQIDFSCGTATFTIKTIMGHAFFLEQAYDLTSVVSIYHDSLRVKYKGDTIATTLYMDGKEVKASPITFTGQRKTLTGFDLTPDAGRGDTITILTKGYIHCLSERVSIDTLNIIINRDF